MEKRIRIALIVLAVLLAISLTGLAVRITYLRFFAGGKSTVVLPDNFIGENNNSGHDIDDDAMNDSQSDMENTSAIGTFDNSNSEDSSNDALGSVNAAAVSHDVKDSAPAFSSEEIIVGDFYEVNSVTEEAAFIELYNKNPGDNVRFMESNMLPGDRVTKYYCVRVYHRGPIDLNFRVDVVSQTKNLGNILDITVTRLDNSNRLLSSAFNNINGFVFTETLPGSPDNTTTAYYRVDVSLPTYAGNEYQAASLVADFNWFVIGDRYYINNEEEDIILDDPIEPGNVNVVEESCLLPKPHKMDALCVALAVASAVLTVVLLILFVIIRRCRESER